jgi:hypothetical protein
MLITKDARDKCKHDTYANGEAAKHQDVHACLSWLHVTCSDQGNWQSYQLTSLLACC